MRKEYHRHSSTRYASVFLRQQRQGRPSSLTKEFTPLLSRHHRKKREREREREAISRGVQKDPKPKTRTENPIPEKSVRVPEPKYLVFSVRVPEPIILSGYRFGYGSDFLPKRVPDNPKYFFLEFFVFCFLENPSPKTLFVD